MPYCYNIQNTDKRYLFSLGAGHSVSSIYTRLGDEMIMNI